MSLLIGSRTALLALVSTFTAAEFASAATVSISLDQRDRTVISGGLGSIDLTVGGQAIDWLKPVSTNLFFAEKNAAALLSLSVVGGGTPGLYADDGYAFAWSGADGDSGASPSFQGSNFTAPTQNTGFRLTYTAPAAGPFTITWYTAASTTERFSLSAAIGSATDLRTPGVNTGTTTGPGGVDELFWTITGTADSAGQVLTMDFLKSSATAGGAMAITAATVVPEPASALLLAAGTAGLVLRRRRTTRLV